MLSREGRTVGRGGGLSRVSVKFNTIFSRRDLPGGGIGGTDLAPTLAARQRTNAADCSLSYYRCESSTFTGQPNTVQVTENQPTFRQGVSALVLLPLASSSLIAPGVRMFELQLQASGHIPCVVRLLMTAYTNRRFRTTH